MCNLFFTDFTGFILFGIKKSKMGANGYRARRQFCAAILNLRPRLAARGLNLSSLFFYVDECTFTRNGMFNQKNYVYWTDENPR